MTDRYRQIVSYVNRTAWAIRLEELQVIQEVIATRIRGERWSDEEIAARIDARGGKRGRAQVAQAPGGVAVIPVTGVIIPKADMFSEMSGGTSVTQLEEDFLSAIADPDVGAIVLDVDSPGGSSDLLPEFAARMRSVRGNKPVLAVANTLMASAAYWIACGADEVAVTPSGLAGSIGVYATHQDVSGMQEKLGVKTSLISAGKYKVEGNPYEPLDDSARAFYQNLVDQCYQQFTLDVSKGRGVPVDDVRSGFGEGRVLTAKDSVKAGLADRVATRNETISRAAQYAVDGVKGRSGAGSAVAFGVLPAAVIQKPDEDDQELETDDQDVDGIHEETHAWTAEQAAEAERIAELFDVPAELIYSSTTAVPVDRYVPKNETEEAGRADADSFADGLDALLVAAGELVDQGRSLTAVKRTRLESLRERLDEVLALDARPAAAAMFTEDDAFDAVVSAFDREET